MTAEMRGGVPVTPQQAAIVDHVREHPVTVVSAGAGSGKTYTMVATVLDLIERGLATVNQFVLITFTNKAADELRERIERALADHSRRAEREGDDAGRRLWQRQQERLAGAHIGTIHSYCAHVLKTYGYGERVAHTADISMARSLFTETLADTTEASLAGPDALLFSPDLDWDDHHAAHIIGAILDNIRQRGLDPAIVLAETRAQPDDDGKPYRVALADLVARANAAYTARKDDEQRFDSDDLLGRTADLLTGTSGAAVLRRLGMRWRYLFIDEFQDTDRTQKRILDAHRDHFAGLLVVGDQKQSIYGFRAAVSTLLADLAGENAVAILPLNVSRRPTRKLLDLQNGLFQAMSARYPDLGDPLEASEGTIEPTTALPPLIYAAAETNDRDARIAKTADAIRWLLRQRIDDPDARDGEARTRLVVQGDITILVRANHDLRHYVHGLERHFADTEPRVVVREDVGGRFYHRHEIAATYHLLRLILLPRDDMILSQALRTPYLRDIDASMQEQYILQYGALHGAPLTDWFDHNAPQRAATLDSLRQAVRSDTVPQLLARLYDAFSIREYYIAAGDRQALENLEKLRELARSMFRNEQALTLRQFVGRLQMNILSGQQEEDAELPGTAEAGPVPYIRIMTIHRAKGLQFPIVIIPEIQAPLKREYNPPNFLITPGYGLDVRLPLRDRRETRSASFNQHLADATRSSVEEEMRIFYVAVTRAQHQVILIGSGRTSPLDPSAPRYAWLDEILRAGPRLRSLGAQLSGRVR